MWWTDATLTVTPRRFNTASRGTQLWSRASEIEAELERNRRSRRTLVRDLLLPHISPHSVVLDYGCGLGFAAVAMAEETRSVYGADIATSILRCAELLNSRPNLKYLPVVHGTMAGLADERRLRLLVCRLPVPHPRCQPSGARRDVQGEQARTRILLHVAVDAPGWLTEKECSQIVRRADDRPRFALQCFTRGRDKMVSLIREAGFEDVEKMPASDLTTRRTTSGAAHRHSSSPIGDFVA